MLCFGFKFQRFMTTRFHEFFFQNVAKDNPNITLNMFSIFFSLFQLRSIRSWSRKYQFAQMRSTNFPQIWTVPSSLEISAAVEREGADSRNFHWLQWSDLTKAVGIHARKVSYFYCFLHKISRTCALLSQKWIKKDFKLSEI